MPIHSVAGGGWQWGNHGKIYRGKGAKVKAGAQGRAAYANGYRGPAKKRTVKKARKSPKK